MLSRDAIVLRALRFAGASERFCAWAAFGSRGSADPALSAGHVFTLLCDVLAHGSRLPDDLGIERDAGAIPPPDPDAAHHVDRGIARFVYEVTSDVQASDGGVPEREISATLQRGLTVTWRLLEGGLAAIDRDRLDDAISHWVLHRPTWLASAAEALSCLSRLTTTAPESWPETSEG